MTALALNIIFTVFFFHTIRLAQTRGRNVMVVGVVNYFVASPVCFAISYSTGVTDLSTPTLFWGFVQGICFIVTYYLLCSSMNVSGMAITTAILRLAVVIPVIASILIWDEIPTTLQVVGIVTCLGALPLIGLRTKAREGEARPPITVGVIVVIVLLFVGIGIANLASKAFVESGVPDVNTTFVGVLFGVAGFLGPRVETGSFRCGRRGSPGAHQRREHHIPGDGVGTGGWHHRLSRTGRWRYDSQHPLGGVDLGRAIRGQDDRRDGDRGRRARAD